MKNKHNAAAISREFETFLSEIEALLLQTASLGGDELADAKKRIEERMAAAKGTVSGIREDLAQRARKVAKSANREVHEEPWKIVGTVAAIGLLLGLLLASR